MTRTIVAGIVNGGIYGLIALGIVLVYKGSRVLNFAQGEFGTFALFVAWWLVDKRGMPWLVGAAAGVIVAVAIALFFERLVVRRMIDASRLSVAVATVGLFLLLIALEVVIWSESLLLLRPPLPGLGVRVLGFYVSPSAMLALGTVVLVGIGLAAFLRFTDFGLGVLAAAQDPVATRLVGVRLSRVSAFTWGAAGAIGAVSALLIEPIIGAFAPGSMTELFIRGLAAALVGGLTSLPGAFVGGILVGVLEALVQRQFIQSTFPGISAVMVMLLIIAVLLFRPGGVLARKPA